MKKLKIISLFNISVIILLFVSLIYTFYITSNGIYKSKYSASSTKIEGYIKNIVYSDTNKIYIDDVIVSTKDDLKVGDYVTVYGEFSIPSNNSNFYLFNYKRYLYSKKIHYTVKATKTIKKETKPKYKIRRFIFDRISKYNLSSYIYTFILGDNNYLDELVKESYQTNGISHLFAVSGMHVTFLTALISLFLNKIFKNKYLISFFMCLFLLIYMYITNYSPSIIRAAFLFILCDMNKLFKLNFKNYMILILIFSVSLLYNPYFVYNSGFIFSYLISFSLIVFGRISNNYNNYFIKLLITSLIAYITSIPIVINTSHSINLFTPLINLIFVPLVSFIIFPLSLVVFVIPKLNIIYNFLIYIMENLSLFTSKISLNISFGYINPILMIIYYIVIIMVLVGLLKNKFKYILLLLVLMIIHYNINMFRASNLVSVINVGQGDSILISLAHNKGNILIDAGDLKNIDNTSKEVGKNTIIPYLKSLGIHSLDYFIITHGDFDHIGSANYIINNFNVNEVILNNNEYNSLEKNLIKDLKRINIKYYNDINSLNIGEYKMYLLNTKIYNGENDNSNVIYLKINTYKFLFMGDAGIDKELDILAKYNLGDIDFLKVGHHGSNTSSSEYFINTINPKVSLISVGINNKFGHPKDEVLNRLKNSKIYRTDLDGSIEIKLNKNGYKIRTCPP